MISIPIARRTVSFRMGRTIPVLGATVVQTFPVA